MSPSQILALHQARQAAMQQGNLAQRTSVRETTWAQNKARVEAELAQLAGRKITSRVPTSVQEFEAGRKVATRQLMAAPGSLK